MTKLYKAVLGITLLVVLFLPISAYAADDNVPFYRKSTIKVDQRQYRMVIADCTEEVAQHPKDGTAYYSRGLIFFKGMQYDLAIADYTKAIKINPQKAEYYYHRGSSYLESNKNALAIADYTKALELKPQDEACYIGRGEAYKGSHNDLAMDDFNHVLTMNPGNIGAYEGKRCLLKQYGSKYPCEDDNIRDTSYNPFRE